VFDGLLLTCYVQTMSVRPSMYEFVPFSEQFAGFS